MSMTKHHTSADVITLHEQAQDEQEQGATEVLHDVGNVLNSVGVSMEMLRREWSDPRALSGLRSFVRSARREPDVIERTLRAGPERLLAYFEAMLLQLETSHAALDQQVGQISGTLDEVRRMIREQQKEARAEHHVTVEDLPELVHDVVDVFRERAYNHGVRLNIGGLDRYAVRLDRSRVYRIVCNLVSNAIDAVSDQMPHRRVVDIEVVASDEGPSVRVSDRGVGIDAATADHIFEHGFSTKVDGHGFGLSGCANSAAELGASLRFHSDGPGTGSTFTLTLPWSHGGPRCA